MKKAELRIMVLAQAGCSFGWLYPLAVGEVWTVIQEYHCTWGIARF